MSHYKRSLFERSDHQIRVAVFGKLALTSRIREVSLLCVMSYWTAPSQEELPLPSGRLRFQQDLRELLALRFWIFVLGIDTQTTLSKEFPENP